MITNEFEYYQAFNDKHNKATIILIVKLLKHNSDVAIYIKKKAF